MSFALNGDNVSYRLHVDNSTGDLLLDHFGGFVDGDGIIADVDEVQGWVGAIGRARREFPDLGRGDFRIPAVQIRQAQGYTISNLQYQSHHILEGKPPLPTLPSTFGNEQDVSTLIIHLYDKYSDVAADLTYSIFPRYDAVVRSVNITNLSNDTIHVEKLASFSVDLPYGDLNMLELKGDWARENMRVGVKLTLELKGTLHDCFGVLN